MAPGGHFSRRERQFPECEAILHPYSRLDQFYRLSTARIFMAGNEPALYQGICLFGFGKIPGKLLFAYACEGLKYSYDFFDCVDNKSYMKLCFGDESIGLQSYVAETG